MDEVETEAADKKLYVEFFLHPMVDYLPTFGGEVMKDDEERVEALKTLGCGMRSKPKDPEVLIVSKLGRPVFKEVEFIRILKPGDRDTAVERPVEDEDKFRFEKKYRHWHETRTEAAQGTPLEELSFLNKAQVEEYKFFNIRTAEHLAELSDGVSQKFPLAQQHRKRAQAYLDAAKENAPRLAMADALKERDNEIAELRERLAKLEVAQPQVEEQPARRSARKE
jgi:hypothetical protein